MGTCAYIITKDVLKARRKGEPVLACGAPTKPGSSYCPPHHRLCHRSSRPVDVARVAAEVGRLQARDPHAEAA